MYGQGYILRNLDSEGDALSITFNAACREVYPILGSPLRERQFLQIIKLVIAILSCLEIDDQSEADLSIGCLFQSYVIHLSSSSRVSSQ